MNRAGMARAYTGSLNYRVYRLVDVIDLWLGEKPPCFRAIGNIVIGQFHIILLCGPARNRHPGAGQLCLRGGDGLTVRVILSLDVIAVEIAVLTAEAVVLAPDLFPGSGLDIVALPQIGGHLLRFVLGV